MVIENRADYVRTWGDVEMLPGALSALERLASSDYRIVMVTNQSAVGRGLMTLEAAQEINRRLVELIQQAGGRVDGVYLCPHAPDEACTCRKPQPGLILQAAAELSLDLGRSVLVGDAISDLLAGQTAGVGRLVLVLTGRGATQAQMPERRQVAQFETYASLAEASAALLTA